MSRFSLRHALILTTLLLVAATLALVTPALAGHTSDPSDAARSISVPQAMPTASVPPATLSFNIDPAQDRYNVGDVFTVTVQLDNVTDFFGGQLKMNFDAGNFQVLDTDPVRPYVQVQPGTLLPPGSFVAPLDSSQVNNTTGKILFGGVRLASGQTSGSGSLVVIPFKVTGSCGSMTFADPPIEVDLSNEMSESLSVNLGLRTVARVGQCVFLPHLSVANP